MLLEVLEFEMPVVNTFLIKLPTPEPFELGFVNVLDEELPIIVLFGAFIILPVLGSVV